MCPPGHHLKGNADCKGECDEHVCCAVEASCDTFMCPDGKVLKGNADSLFCPGECDEHACCAKEGSCDLYVCPFGHVTRPHTYCSDMTCASVRDRHRCCFIPAGARKPMK